MSRIAYNYDAEYIVLSLCQTDAICPQQKNVDTLNSDFSASISWILTCFV